MKFTKSKISASILAALLLPACGSSDGDDPASTTDTLTSVAASVENIAVNGLVTDNNANVCVDMNNDSLCTNSDIALKFKSSSEEYFSEFNSKDKNVVDKAVLAFSSDGNTYANEISDSNITTNAVTTKYKVNINALTTLVYQYQKASGKTKQEAEKEVAKKLGLPDTSLFNSNIKEDSSLKVLVRALDILDRNGLQDLEGLSETQILNKLDDAYKNIKQGFEEGLKEDNIEASILANKNNDPFTHIPSKSDINNNSAPVADTPSIEVNELNVNFSVNVTDADGDNLSYEWNFGDGFKSNSKAPSHKYAKAGTYKVTVIISDGKVYVKKNVDVKISASENTPPTAEFSFTRKNADTFVFTNKSKDADGDKLTYTWDFGDGETSQETNPTHTYAENKTYTVTLKVSDGSTTVSKSYKIKVTSETTNNAPEASFSTQISKTTVKFNNTSTDKDGDALEYSWNFDDGKTSSEENPTHDFGKCGVFNVQLTVSDGMDSNTVNQAVKITDCGEGPENNPPEAGFTYKVDGNNVVFTNTSFDKDGDELVYLWDFGDGQTSEEKSPTHAYASTDKKYVVKLQVTDGEVISNTSKTISFDNPEIEITALFSVSKNNDTLTATFKNNSEYPEDAQCTFEWDFGDGKKSSEKDPVHQYATAKTYTVKLSVMCDGKANTITKNVPFTRNNDICDANDPYCKGDIDPPECKQTCETKSEVVCTDPVETNAMTTLANGTASTPAITTPYYATNPNGQVGKNKTISSMSDWDSSMIIAQGAANDDPRAFRGYHEKPTDFYALYAAWDDSNLYLMVEMPNIQGFEPGGDFDYSSDQFLPMGIGIRTGVRTPGNGLSTEDTNIWTAGKFYNIEEGIDTLLMFHPRLPTVNTPGLFKTNAQGLFSYNEKDGSLIGFTKAGIERSVEHKILSSKYMGIPDNYGKDTSFYLSGEYKDLIKENDNPSGHLYQITIPLASIDITKEHIEKNGIAVLAFSTFGESMMDALPWTPNLVDNATTPYSKDDSTSNEKEDMDIYDVPLARIGKSDLGPGKTCTTVEKTVCTPETIPESCADLPSDIEMSIDSDVQDLGKFVEATVSVETGYTGVTYKWEASNGVKDTTSYDKTSKTFKFTKGKEDKQITITVKASNPAGTRGAEESIVIDVPACTGDQCGGSSSEYAEHLGTTDERLPVYDPNNTCKIGEGEFVLKANTNTVPNVYVYTKDETTVSAVWPGDAMTKVDGCDTPTWSYSKASAGNLAIFNNVDGQPQYPGEKQPGVEVNFNTPCFDWESKKFVSEDVCGLGSTAPTDAAYAYVNGQKLDSGKTITISAKDDVPTSQYVDVALSVFGANATENSTGTYFIDGVEYSFTNREVIRIGEKIEAADTENGEEPAVITLKVVYNNAESTYTIKKVKYTKPVAKTDFSWDNALVYFVMTDRFENGKTSNDNSFGRPKVDTKNNSTATFHGGDIVGMTKRLDYLKSLGMNAIWITAPYEQAHGWVGGGSSGNFAHYAYHGYYALDFTSLDPNIGTVDEFRTFVTEAHKRGIRVVLDIVMNHSGYATLKDMCDFGFGVRGDGGDPCNEWIPGNGQTYHNKPILEQPDSRWDSWWGKDWLRFGGYGGCGGDDLTKCLDYLPDFKNEPNGPSVGIPTFLKNKWSKPNSDYDIPAAGKFRTGNMSVVEFEANWLASWVEEFGIDGFRCDTAKHIEKASWKILKERSSAALKKWRENNANGDDPAASWTDDFWMTGEAWGFGQDSVDGSGYASAGGFNSMINFSFNGSKGGACGIPKESDWKTYGSKYGLGGTSPKLNALTYVSSHDTSLCRPGDNKALGTGLLLLPGGVQVYYGDETARPNDNGGSGNDQEHGTRSDMNFPSDIDNASEWAQNADTLSTSFSSNASLAHWQKVGQFRARNVAVGAGKLSETADGSHCRTYNNAEKNIVNSVVIHVGSASSVNVGSCFEDGTELQDGYSGATGVVSGGSVSLSGTGDLILLELKR